MFPRFMHKILTNTEGFIWRLHPRLGYSPLGDKAGPTVEEMIAQTSIAGKQQVLWYTRGNANVNPSITTLSIDKTKKR